jgi:hypothetical protein
MLFHDHLVAVTEIGRRLHTSFSHLVILNLFQDPFLRTRGVLGSAHNLAEVAWVPRSAPRLAGLFRVGCSMGPETSSG